MLHAPSLPEIVRVDTSDLRSAIAHLVQFLQPSGGNFNYLDGTKRVQAAYRGLHSLPSLVAATVGRKKAVGHQYNIDVVKLAAPVAFGRSTRVFHLSARKLPYGDGRLASYRIPFFFVESGVYKAYFLQPRKNTHFTPEQFGLFSTVVRRNLLENEFYGERFNLEIIDVSSPLDKKDRIVQRFGLEDFQVWNDSAVDQHFKVVNEALRVIEAEKLVSKVRRPLKDHNLSLFD